MASKNAYRRKWLRWQKTYEKRALKEVRKVINTWVKSIDWTLINSSNYEDEIGKTFDIQLMYDAYGKIYTEIGKTHGVRVGKGINLQVKSFNPFDFIGGYEGIIQRYIVDVLGKNITSVKENCISDIIQIIKNQFFKEYDIFDTTQSILDVINNPGAYFESPKFYRWQAERIARTESVGAANYAALQAAEVSGYVMMKLWISATDERVRTHSKGDLYDHVEMDGHQIPLHDEFVFNGGADYLQFPGDATGEPGNVINCRCTVAPIPARDINGNLISTN